ncbi:T9SS type A sorting domain-containing protein [Taibaiella koreensis]|uniref:T9SS type A sorting domain-containing protein n=1 Tax=Taibaiella koreensis TaxID=1268548 RepID=UPI0013C2CE3F|nr:T9SS type A sorting domain-containing protein [Taibaiella koreensis]
MKYKLLLLLLSIPVLTTAQSLSLDSGFGDNGAATTQNTSWGQEAYNMIRQPDGKLLVVGVEYTKGNVPYTYHSLISRFLPNGQPDNSFGVNGSVRIETGNKNSAQALSLQADGKIVIAGDETIIHEYGNPPSAEIISKPFIARLLPNGALDNSFGTNGIHGLDVLDTYFSNKELATIAVQPDGKIVAGGTGVAVAEAKMYLVRLHTDGTYDNSFGTSGLGQYTIENGKNAALWDMAIQSDNRIILAGATGSANLPSAEDMSFALARINTDGTPDISFGTQGSVSTRLTTDYALEIVDVAYRVILSPDGKICVAGAAGSRLGMARYLANGTPDPTFGQNGKIVHPQHPAGEGLVWRDGKLYTCSSVTVADYTTDISISAFNADGSTDNSFAPNGKMTTHIFQNNYAHTLLAQPDGKLLTAGAFSDEDRKGGFLLTRFRSAGANGISGTKGGQLSLSLYPNPASDLLILSCSNAGSSLQGDIAIISASGQSVYAAKLTGSRTTIPVSQLAAGVYGLRVSTGTGIQTLSFVKKSF